MFERWRRIRQEWLEARKAQEEELDMQTLTVARRLDEIHMRTGWTASEFTLLYNIGLEAIGKIPMPQREVGMLVANLADQKFLYSHAKKNLPPEFCVSPLGNEHLEALLSKRSGVNQG